MCPKFDRKLSKITSTIFLSALQFCDFFTFALLFFNAKWSARKETDVNSSLESNTGVHKENNSI